MVIIHHSSTAPQRDSLKFGLQSFLLRLSRLMAKILKQIRLSTSQVVSNFLDFTERKMVFITRTVYLNFKEPIPFDITITGNINRRTCVRTPYIQPLNGLVLRRT